MTVASFPPDLPTRILDAHPDAKVLSLDFFDTLVTRRVAQPTHVFAEIERGLVADLGGKWRGYALARVQAEDEARRIAHIDDPDRDVTLDEITAVLAGMLGLTHEERTMVAERETRTETALAIRVMLGEALLAQARARGLRVVVVSDNYMPAAHLVAMAAASGITIHGSEVFVSCEHGGMKQNGAIWPTILAALGVDGRHVLHVGDNETADGTLPQRHGIVTCVHSVLDRAHRERTNTSPAVLPLSRLEADWQLSGQSDSTVSIADKLGHGLVALIAAAQVQDVLGVVSRRPVAGVHFAARDGYLAHKVWDVAVSRTAVVPPSNYLAFSRSVIWRANLREVTAETAVRFVDAHETLTPRRLGARFGCTMRTVLSQDAGIDATAARRMVVENADAILESARALRTRFLGYLRKQGLLDPGHHLVVDLGWRGSTVADLAELVHAESGGAATVEGRFVGLYWDATMNRTRAALHGLAVDDMSALDDQIRLLGSVRLFESLFTAPHGSIVDFGDESTGFAPVHAKSSVETDAWTDFGMQVHTSAIRSAVEIVEGRHRSGVTADDLDRDSVWAAMMQVGHTPRHDEVHALSALRHVASVDHSDDGIPLVAAAPRWSATVPAQRYGEIYDRTIKTHWLQGSVTDWLAHAHTHAFAAHMVATWPFLAPQWVSAPLR